MTGTSLGSNDDAALKTPRVLLAWDAPTRTLSAGWTRYVLERRFGQAVTAVRTASLGRVDFADYDVIVLPSGNYAGQINDAVLNRIKDWLRCGGTLVTLAEAPRVGDADAKRRPARHDGAAQGRRGPTCPPPASRRRCQRRAARCRQATRRRSRPTFDYDKAIQPDRERPASQPGAILRVTLDTDHWLTAGNDAETQVMIEGIRVFAPHQAEHRPQRRRLRDEGHS